MSKNSSTIQELVRTVAPVLILVLGAGGFVFLKQKREVPARAAAAKEAFTVDTATVVPYTDALTIQVDGQVVPYREIELSAEVAGRIEDKEDVCRAGKFVRGGQQGQLLLKIDPRDYELEKDRLTKELDQAEVAIEELDVEVENTQALIDLAQDELKLQEAERDRQIKLLEESAGSPSAVDQAKRSVLQARNALLTAQNQLNLLNTRRSRLLSAHELKEVQSRRADLDLERTSVVSPIDGMVVSESVEVDSYVQKGAPLVIIEDTSMTEVRCQLRMDELYWIWAQVSDDVAQAVARDAQRDYQIPETPVTVIYDLAGEEYVWSGTLWRYDGIGLDERTRTVPCRIRVDSPRDVRLRTPGGLVEPKSGPPALVRGMFVALEIQAKPRANLLQLREEAVQPGPMAWCVRDSKLHAAKLQVVEVFDGVAVVRAKDDKLRLGDRVVISPLAEAREGMEVQERRPAADQSVGSRQVALATEEAAR